MPRVSNSQWKSRGFVPNYLTTNRSPGPPCQGYPTASRIPGSVCRGIQRPIRDQGLPANVSNRQYDIRASVPADVSNSQNEPRASVPRYPTAYKRPGPLCPAIRQPIAKQGSFRWINFFMEGQLSGNNLVTQSKPMKIWYPLPRGCGDCL